MREGLRLPEGIQHRLISSLLCAGLIGLSDDLMQYLGLSVQLVLRDES